MKYFDRDGKHNFVDANNVVVGYDNQQCCCEHAGFYYVGGVEPTEATSVSDDRPLPDEALLDVYNFDPEWFKTLPSLGSDLDDGGACAFRLTADGLPDLYLVLFNAHNGYYSHGFDATVGGVVIRSGSL